MAEKMRGVTLIADWTPKPDFVLEPILVTGEVLQVKKARIVGAQGHSGYGTFPRVIECMAAGMDMLPLITKKVGLDAIPEQIVSLRTNRTDCKITYVAD